MWSWNGIIRKVFTPDYNSNNQMVTHTWPGGPTSKHYTLNQYWINVGTSSNTKPASAECMFSLPTPNNMMCVFSARHAFFITLTTNYSLTANEMSCSHPGQTSSLSWSSSENSRARVYNSHDDNCIYHSTIKLGDNSSRSHIMRQLPQIYLILILMQGFWDMNIIKK